MYIKSTRTLRSSLLGGATLTALVLSEAAMAQQAPAPDEVIVTGTRQVIQDSINLKRNNVQIVDGLSADEIGDLPALSIGEALESITGVASHRENGGATEVSIRGLGPYLSSTVVNGRAATNGSGDRSVNFSQFPSELMNKLAVFKSQDASQIEGGVAGQIQLETLKPLEFGKQRIQLELKGNVNPDQLNQSDTEAGDIGYRVTGSYIDQFEIGGLGDVGVSLGLQTSRISQPEAESRSTSSGSNSRPACLITNGNARFEDSIFGGTFTGFSNNPETEDRGDDDCDDFNDRDNEFSEDQRGSDTEGVDTAIDSDTGLPVDFGTPFVFAPSQRHYRQNDTLDERNAFFGALQFQPNDRLDINVDGQYSVRTQSEQRNDLTFNGFRRNDTSLNIGTGTSDQTTLDTLQYTDSGAILFQVTDNTIEIQGGDFEREETYLGGGVNVSYDVTDRLTIAADYGYSKTERVENAKEFRIQSDISPVIAYDETQGTVPVYTLYDEDFDVNDYDNYVDRLRVRIDNDVETTNVINSARFDVNYELDDGLFTNVSAGLRYAVQEFDSLDGGDASDDPFDTGTGRFSFEIENNTDLEINSRQVVDGDGTAATGLASSWVDIIASTNAACRTDFPEDDFLSSVRDGDLVTVVGDDGSVISSSNSWATFDASCVADTAVASLNSVLADINLAIADRGDDGDPSTDGTQLIPLTTLSSAIPETAIDNPANVFVDETTTALYAMTNYETSLDGLPLSGNIGLRVVQTEVEAVGYRASYAVSVNDDGEFSISEVAGENELVSIEHDYTEFLPSANAILEISDNKVVRLGAFRAMSRPDPADMGFDRELDIDNDDVATSLSELISDYSGDGNPAFDPLMSWNFDAGYEWYPNSDSILALGVYYKSFQGGFENVTSSEDVVIDGVATSLPITLTQTSENESSLFGVEFTGSHRFSYLPGYLSGLGAKVSYNYVQSDFEFEDSRYGDRFVTNLDGSVTQIAEGIIAPAGLPGLSENTFSGTVYYQLGGFDGSVIYKYRDDYFQPFTADGSRLRYIGDVGVWEARASYEVNENFRLSLEAINLFSEPKEQYAYVEDDLYEVNDYGPRVFFGVRARF